MIRSFYCLMGILMLFSFTQKAKKTKLKLPKSYVFVPSGNCNTSDGLVSVKAFYMSNHEVTNAEYREFLAELKATGQTDKYETAYPDTTTWAQLNSFSGPLTNLYFWHPAYANYPVVNITPEGAQLYCQWLTGKLRNEFGNQIEAATLPTQPEWTLAAQAGQPQAIYPWHGPYLRNAKGCFLANFKVIGDQNIRQTENGFEIVTDSSFAFNPADLDNFTVTAPAMSYPPNDFGLYNMSGNVAELTQEGKALGGHWNATGYDIRISSAFDFEQASPFVGFRPIIRYMNPG